MKINETAIFEGEGETQDKNRLQKLEPAKIPSREEAPEKFQKLKFITKFGKFGHRVIRGILFVKLTAVLAHLRRSATLIIYSCSQ